MKVLGTFTVIAILVSGFFMAQSPLMACYVDDQGNTIGTCSDYTQNSPLASDENDTKPCAGGCFLDGLDDL